VAAVTRGLHAADAGPMRDPTLGVGRDGNEPLRGFVRRQIRARLPAPGAGDRIVRFASLGLLRARALPWLP